MKTLVLIVSILLGGCALSIIPQADFNKALAPDGGVIVFGSITYIIDGEVQLPYGAFRPAIPAPHVDLLRIEDGKPFQSHGVASADGSFSWRMQPGHYVISGIGQGQFIDDYRITWPRLAFKVSAGDAPMYLGDLQLIGKRYAEPYTLSTGSTGVSKGIRYEFSVIEALSSKRLPSGRPAETSLIVQRPNMLIGEQLIDRLGISPEQVIAEIFGP
ncbi:hypothetical protein [Zhongshania sp.]|uniref:hypothetical protein n=1 Tax=Zhongshania sp. TaxID=1971902 RepID=UPI003565E6B1